MKKYTKYILLLMVLTIQTNVFAGGPWPQNKGKGYFKLSEWWTVFDQHYTDLGKIDPNLTTGIFNTNLYAEYGLTNRITTIVNMPLFSRNYMNNLRSATTSEIIIPGESINSVGDLDLGFKYGLSKPGAKIAVSATLILGIPLGQTAGGSLENLQTGDGEFNQMVQFDFGKSFQINNIPAYISAFTGINNRTNEFSEEFRIGGEIGLGLMDSKLWVNTRINAVESLKNGATAETVNSTSIFANNTEYLSLGFEANLYLSKNIGISAGFATALRGEIIAAAPSYSVGVFLDLK